MKYVSLYLVIVFSLVLLFSSCSVTNPHTVTTNPKVTASGEGDPVIYDDYFDTNCLEKPTYEDVMNVCEGMGIADIIKYIGKPHNIGPFSGVPSLEWQVTDGSTCCIIFSISQDAPKNISAIEQLMEYGVALSVVITNSEG